MINTEFEEFGVFENDRGEKFSLKKGLRDFLKPSWKEMLIPRKDIKGMKFSLGYGNSVYEAEKILNDCNLSFVDKNILEVGCHNGNSVYALAKFQGAKVHGIDILEYGILQTPDMEVTDKDKENQQKFLDWQREQFSKFFSKSVTEKVTFETASISEYVKEETYDVIVSWDTLEHLPNVKLALSNIYKSLKKGGVFYSEYNPFFCISGGHSLCTLDFPYGHCILTEKEFERYITTIRPDEVKPALNFYKHNLNRLSIKELLKYIEEVGFKILVFKGHIPFEYEWKEKIDKELLPLVNKVYPDVCSDDMLYDVVYMLLVKQ